MDRAPVRAYDTFEDRLKDEVMPRNFSLKTKSQKRTPLTTAGFSPYVAERTSENGVEKIKISHAGGPITKHTQMIPPSILNPDTDYDEELIRSWTPHLSLSVADDNSGKPLSGAQIDTQMQQTRWVPHFFMNPMQDLDYITIEAIMRFTFIGPLMDTLVKFIAGTGFKPELELINPSTDKDKNDKTIQDNQDIIDTLTQIDSQIDKDDSQFIDTTFTEKITSLISTALGFNRSALVFGYDAPVSVNGTTYKQIPSSLKFAHPRDLGIIEVDPGTWRLKSVQWRNAYYMIPATDMIYLWNPITSAKTRNSWLYGDSMIMPMIDAARVIRKNIGVNFPAMAEATWSGMPIITIKPQGQSQGDKQNEYAAIANSLVRGGPNILLEDPADTRVDNIDFNPKVNDFVALTEMLIKYSIAATGLPHSAFYDEDSSNRATMIGKLQLAKDTVINPMRAWIGRQISNMWYQRWFRLIYSESKSDIVKQFRIKMTFSDLHIEEWYDKIQSVNLLDSRKQLTDEAYGELAGIDNYQNKVEAGAQTIPGGGANKKMQFGSGEGFQISKTDPTQ